MGKPKAKKVNKFPKVAQLGERQRQHSKQGDLVPESALNHNTSCCSVDFPILSWATTDSVMSMVPEFDLSVFYFGSLYLCLHVYIYTYTCIYIYVHTHVHTAVVGFLSFCCYYLR